MKQRTSLAVALVPLCVGLALTAGPTYAGPTATTSTTFAFKTSGFGTRVIGGQVPVGSATTGYQVIGCTNQAGRSRTNNVAEATLPGLGTASGIRTHVWTSSRKRLTARCTRPGSARRDGAARTIPPPPGCPNAPRSLPRGMPCQ